MAMRAKNAPRRLYTRGGSLLCMIGGVFYGPPANKESNIDGDREVTIEELEKSGGKKRIAVTQKKSKEKVTENWLEKHLEPKVRGEATA